MSEIRTPPRKLVDLNPKWITTHEKGEIYGISYDCPCDPPYNDCGGRQIVPVKTSWDSRPVCADSLARGWDLTGDSFETVTLSPSIHQVGHWHGYLRNGVVESC